MQFEQIVRDSLSNDRNIFHNLCLLLTQCEEELPMYRIDQNDEYLLSSSINNDVEEEIELQKWEKCRLIQLIRRMNSERIYFREQCIGLLNSFFDLETNSSSERQQDFKRFLAKNCFIHLELTQYFLRKYKNENESLKEQLQCKQKDIQLLNVRVLDLEKKLAQSRNSLKKYLLNETQEINLKKYSAESTSNMQSYSDLMHHNHINNQQNNDKDKHTLKIGLDNCFRIIQTNDQHIENQHKNKIKVLGINENQRVNQNTLQQQVKQERPSSQNPPISKSASIQQIQIQGSKKSIKISQGKSPSPNKYMEYNSDKKKTQREIELLKSKGSFKLNQYIN